MYVLYPQRGKKYGNLQSIYNLAIPEAALRPTSRWRRGQKHQAPSELSERAYKRDYNGLS